MFFGETRLHRIFGLRLHTMALQKGPYIMLIAMLFLLMAGLGATLRAPDVQFVLKHPKPVIMISLQHFHGDPTAAGTTVSHTVARRSTNQRQVIILRNV